MDQINFQPLFEYLDEKFGAVDERFDHVEERLENLETSADNVSKEMKETREELRVSNHRHDKTEDWVTRVAPGVGIPFEQ